jgi:LPS-assembly protein
VGTAHHAWITFKRVPIFYSPYLTFPLSDQRRSGFLAPSYRVSSASGLELTVPYYLNLAPNYDATVGLRGMTERGVQLQGEFRYLTTRGQGQLGLELMPDDRKFGSGRSAVSFQHTGYFAERWSANVNFNRLSDRQYFEDLGTNLAIASQTFAERRADVYRWGNGWYALGRLQSFQTLDRRLPGGSRPYERLPQLMAVYRPAERNRQVNFSGTAELVHFDRRDSVTGVRMDLRPTVSYPIRGTAGFIEPRATLRQTLYSLDGTAPGAKRTPTRTIPTFSVDSGLFFERNLEIRGQSLVQTLEPRAFYLFTPPTNQDDLPVFDTGRFTFAFAQLFREDRFSGADRVGDAHQVALALTSRVLDPAGGELVRGSVGQILFLRDRRITLPGQARETDSVSNLVGEVSANLGRRWRVLGGLQWDPHATRTERSTVALRYQPDPLRVVNAAYRFLRQAPGVVGSVEQMDLSFAWPVARHWRAVGRWNHSLPDNRMLEAFGGLEYESCCWAFRAVGRRYLSSTEGEHTNAIFFQLELKGLTGIGRGTVSFLERSIPGYENPF